MKKLMEVLENRHDNYIFPFFWQHGETEEKLREYMKAIYDTGIRAVCLECRPHPDFLGPKWWHDFDIILDEAKSRGMKIWILDDAHFPTGFTNGALKDEADDKWKQFLTVKTFSLTGPMKDVVIDVGSQVKYMPPLMGSMQTLMGVQPVTRSFRDEELLSATLITALQDGVDGQTVTDYTDRIQDGKLVIDVPAGTSRFNIIFKTRNGGGNSGYINLISGPSVKVLLDTVYEPHFERYKEYFGNIIEGFFSDEPQLGNINGFDNDNRLGKDMQLPWSEELEENLRKRLGKDFEKALPLLWLPDRTGKLSNQVRYIYMDEMTLLVQKDFSHQIGDWCQDHGVRYIGHIIEDDGLHARMGSSVGHYFRGLSGQHMAGIDDIGNQVFPGGEDGNRKPTFGVSGSGFRISADFYHFALGKLGASHAAFDPRKKGDSMCEIFGAYGWSEGTREMKYLADHFLVRGINHFVPHAFSPKEFPDPDCPPHFYAHGLNPLYQGFGELMGYLNRSAHLLSGGKAEAPVMVLYHGEQEWTSFDEGMTFSRTPARTLLENQLDMLFVWMDALKDPDHFYGTSVEEGVLTVNGIKSRILVIPGSRIILKDLAVFIKDSAQKGLKILFTDTMPEKVLDPEDREGKSEEALKALLEEVCRLTSCVKEEELPDICREVRDVTLSHEFKDLRYYHYRTGDEQKDDLYMFSNESAGEVFEGWVSFKSSGIPVFYDAMKNEVFKAEAEDGKVYLKLSPYESIFMILTDEEGSKELEKEHALRKAFTSTPAAMEVQEVTGPFRVSFKDALHQEEGFIDLQILEKPVSLTDIKPGFSGWVLYETETDIKAEDDKEIILSLTDAYESVEVFVNGSSAGIRISPPYKFDITELVKDGKNDLQLICATTLENAVNEIVNALPDTPENFMAKMFNTPVKTPFGIIGPVCILISQA